MKNPLNSIVGLTFHCFRATKALFAKIKIQILTVGRWHIPGYGRRALYLQAAVALAGAVIFEYWHPIPGVAIGLLGCVAALMAFEGWTGREKGVWTVFVFVLFAVELHAIYADRDTHDAEQASLRTAEENARRKERDSFRALLDQGQSLFVSQERFSKEDRDQMTGGDSYVAVAPLLISIKGPNTFRLIAYIGKNGERRSIPDAHIYVRKLPIPNEGTKLQFLDMLNNSGAENGPVFVGTISRDWSQILPNTITPSLEGTTEYVVNVFANNKPTTETFRIRMNVVTHKWEYSYKIIRETQDMGPNKLSTFKTLEITEPEWRSLAFVESK